MTPPPARPEVHDPGQLTRIEGVHRGFFYQHLYAVACLLAAEAVGIRDVYVETDEDIELQTEQQRWYVQVKSRAASLKPSDIADTLSRFETLRQLHSSGDRRPGAKFAIVANVEPSTELMRRLPSDVVLITPRHHPIESTALPPASINVPTAFAAVSETSSKVPLSRLTGETLALKLSALVQMAASGSAPFTDHRFRVSDLPALFEQIAIQLQDFPPADPAYEPQQNEPIFENGKPVRIITAISGGGKSAWAAQAAVSTQTPVLYFDVGDAPAGTVATALAREFTAKLATHGTDVRPAILPGRSGLDSLRTLDAIIRDQQTAVAIFIDNAHHIGLDELRALVAALPNQNLLLLAQPSEDLNALATLLNITTEPLEGWSLPSIAKVFSRHGTPIDLTTSDQIRAITGATPLYVRQAAELTSSHFQGDANSFCASVTSGTHTVTTAQETILRSAVAALDDTGRIILAASTVADVPLNRDELAQLAAPLLDDERSIARGIRLATDRGILVATAGGALVLHDAFRVLGRDLLDAYDVTIKTRVLQNLRDTLQRSLGQHGDVRRISLLLRTLAEVGETEVLLDAITTEFFHEFGLSTELEHLVLDALQTPALAAADRFWALDTLAFWRLQNGDVTGAEAFVMDMAAEVEVLGTNRSAATAFKMKAMLIAARRGKRKDCQIAFQDALHFAGDDTLLQRIVRYNYAVSAYWLGRRDDAANYARKLADEYVGAVGLRWSDIVAVNPPAIAARLEPLDSVRQDTLKHLADCLDLFARSVSGKDATLARVNAVKLYTLAWAGTSVVRVGMDAVDDLLRTTDASTARMFIEGTLLPALQRFRLLNHVVEVKAQYAVVLAYCGEDPAASAQIEELRPVVAALSERAREEFENQAQLVVTIAHGRNPAEVE